MMLRDLFARLSKARPAYRWGAVLLVSLLVCGLLVSLPRGAKGTPTSQPGSTPMASASGSDLPVALGSGDADTTSGWQASIWVVAALLAVVGLLYGSLWLLRATNLQARLAGGQASMVRLQTSVRLNHNQTLHLVQFGSQMLLIGASQTGLSLLAQEPAARKDNAAQPPAFSAALQDALKEDRP